jgi:DNA-binding response OmpR family regulator
MDLRKKILIADDDAVNIEFFKVMLPKLGYLLDTTEDGEECLGLVKKSPPDILLLGAILKNLSGWDILGKLKNDPALAGIPVILLSDVATIKDKVEAFEQGADDYIGKPFNFTELLARVRSLLKSRELFIQLSARESRLGLAEKLTEDFQTSISAFLSNIDELDEAITLAKKDLINEKTRPAIFALVREKLNGIRQDAEALDKRIKKANAEWDELKKNEIKINEI